jgi:hypothetical protein
MAMSVPPEDPEFLRDLNDRARTRRFDSPGADYDPLTADGPHLDRLGFPPRPDAATQSELRDLWFMMFTPPLAPIDFDFVLYPPVEENALRRGSSAGSRGRQTSLNWSGASIVARNGEMFTDVVGAWHVPTVSVPTNPPAGVTDFRSSTWIGLDGQRSYINATLPQIGTAQRVERISATVDKVTTYSWLEWFPTIKEVTLTGLPISPGHRVAAWLRVIPPDPTAIPAEPMAVRMLIMNLSFPGPKPYAAFQIPVPRVTFPPGSPFKVQPEVAGATAEWIMERPTAPTGLPRELPHFDEVVFNPCFALTAPDLSGPFQVAKFAGVNLIQMFRRENAPSGGTRVLAKAKRTGRNAFKIAPRAP